MSQGPNLLIVDDTEINLILLQNVVRPIDVNVIAASSGEEALIKTKGLELALAIVDVRMPGMDGFELAVKLNEERSGNKVPVIFLTANRYNDNDAFLGYNSGAVDYLIKPIDNTILICKINVFIDLFNHKQRILRDAELLADAAAKLSSANTALKKSEGRLRDIMFSMADWVWEVDEKGVYTYSSNKGSDLLGVSPDEIIGKTMFDFMPQEEVKRATAIFADIMSNKAAIKDFESWNIGRNGDRICLLTNGVPIIDEKGNFRGYRGIDKDITERKCAEAALRESEEKFRSVTQSAHDAIITVNSEGIITDWNEGAEKIFGYLEYEITRKNLAVLLPSQYRELYVKNIGNISKSQDFDLVGKVFEFSALRKNGEEFPVEMSLAQWETDSGKFFTGIIRDITRRKRMEKELREANTFLDSIVENIPNTIFIKDALNLKFIRFNRAGEDLMGIPEREILGKDDYDFFSKEVADQNLQKEREILISRKMLDIPEEPIHTKNRGNRILHTKKVPILNENGDAEYLLGISEDITEHKIAENTLKVSEEKYRTMVNASPNGILLIDMDGVIREVSEIALEMLGTDNRKDLIGRHFYHFIPADEINSIREIFEKTTTEGICQNIEIKILNKNKSLFLSEISATLIQDGDGHPLSFMIIISDISFRKTMETKQNHADRMANLGEMASGIAHEINQPLNIISMVMDKILYQTAKTDSVDVEFLKSKSDKIFENIIRIRNIIDHVRGFFAQ